MHSDCTTKRCPTCGETKPATSEYFYRNKNAPGGLYYYCKACVSAYQHVYRHENKERITASRREYHREYRRRRPRGYNAKYERAWREANPERVRLYRRAVRQRRRARTRQAEGTHTFSDIQSQYARQKGKCYWCKVKVGDDYHVDHVVPLSRGGTNWPENIVISCPTCNMSRQDKLPHEWAEGGRLL